MSLATAAQPRTYQADASIARFSVARYQRMIESDIINEQDQVELLENYVVLKMSRNPKHDGSIIQLLEVLFPLRPPGWVLRPQSAITTSDSQPEPDYVLARGTIAQFKHHHPQPDEIGLVVEISDSSLLRDTADKTRIYARAGIPAYWVINLVDNAVEVYTQPSGPTEAPDYANHRTVRPPETVPLVLDGVKVADIPAADLL